MKPWVLSRAPFVALLITPIIWMACAGEPDCPPAGYQRYTSTDNGFQMDIPEGWDVVPDYSIAYQGEELVGDAFRGPKVGDYRVNVTVISRSVAGFTAEQAYANEISQARSDHPDLQLAAGTVDGHPAKIFKFEAIGEAYFVEVSEAHVILGDTEWIITLANDAALRSEAVFDRMLDSFEEASP